MLSRCEGSSAEVLKTEEEEVCEEVVSGDEEEKLHSKDGVQSGCMKIRGSPEAEVNGMLVSSLL